MADEYTHIIFDWTRLSLVPRVERDGRDDILGPEVIWDCPHAIYRSVGSEITNFDNPYIIVPKNQSSFVDEETQPDTEYYYQISELRPGGEYFTDKYTRLRYEFKTLNITYRGSGSAPSWPFDLVRRRNRFTNRTFTVAVPRTTLEPDDVLGNDGILWDDWVYSGEGTPREFIIIYLDGRLLRARQKSGSVSIFCDTQKVDYDLRNYEPPRIMSSDDWYLPRHRFGTGTTEGISGDDFIWVAHRPRPEWWDDYANSVTDGDTNSWHSFWNSRMGLDDNRRNSRDNSEWYNDTW